MWSTHQVLEIKNGGEYVNQPFEEYLLCFGIDWEQSVPHTPQQNARIRY
jgi:hypothetical protein